MEDNRVRPSFTLYLPNGWMVPIPRSTATLITLTQQTCSASTFRMKRLTFPGACVSPWHEEADSRAVCLDVFNVSKKKRKEIVEPWYP